MPTVQRCSTPRFRQPSARPVSRWPRSTTGFAVVSIQFTVSDIWAVWVMPPIWAVTVKVPEPAAVPEGTCTAKLNGTFMLSATALLVTLPAELPTDTLN